MAKQDPGRRRETKGERTRRRLFETAVDRFQADGYEQASLRAIARDAGVTPALLYRYFDGKEAIVAELYGRLIDDWSTRAEGMPRGTWAERTIWLTELAFDVLGPYRDLLRVLAGSMVDGDPTASPVKNETARAIARPTFRRAVGEATDAPKDVATYADLAYLGHLVMILYWVMDQSPSQEATRALMDQSRGLAPFMKIALKTPIVGRRILALGATLLRGLEGEAR